MRACLLNQEYYISVFATFLYKPAEICLAGGAEWSQVHLQFEVIHSQSILSHFSQILERDMQSFGVHTEETSCSVLSFFLFIIMDESLKTTWQRSINHNLRPRFIVSRLFLVTITVLTVFCWLILSQNTTKLGKLLVFAQLSYWTQAGIWYPML